MEFKSPDPLPDIKKGARPKNTDKPSGSSRKLGNELSDSDRQELSLRDREISRLHELIRSAPDIREEKVEKLRRQIQGGSYKIKAEKIAEKIIKGNPLDEIT